MKPHPQTEKMMTSTAQLNRHTSAPLVASLRERNSTMTEAEAKLAVARVFDALSTLMTADEPVRVAGFGTFRRVYQEGRQARNPATGEPIQTAAKHVVKFKQGKPAK
jgi:nucleoid DNA-binding protein